MMAGLGNPPIYRDKGIQKFILAYIPDEEKKANLHSSSRLRTLWTVQYITERWEQTLLQKTQKGAISMLNLTLKSKRILLL